MNTTFSEKPDLKDIESMSYQEVVISGRGKWDGYSFEYALDNLFEDGRNTKEFLKILTAIVVTLSTSLGLEVDGIILESLLMIALLLEVFGVKFILNAIHYLFSKKTMKVKLKDLGIIKSGTITTDMLKAREESYGELQSEQHHPKNIVTDIQHEDKTE